MCKVTSAGADVGRAWVQMYTAPGGSTAATNCHDAICSTIDARHVWFHQLTGTHAAGTTLKRVIYDPKTRPLTRYMLTQAAIQALLVGCAKV